MSLTNLDLSGSRTSAYTRAGRVLVVILAGVLPAAIAAIGIALMYSWTPELPNPIAIHWSGSGVPDGFGSVHLLAAMLGLIVATFSAFTVVALLRQRATDSAAHRSRFLVATSAWLAAFLTIGVVGSVGQQRGVADATQAPTPVGSLLLGLGVAIVVGVVAWLLAPRATIVDPPAGQEVPELALSHDERVLWTRSVSPAPTVVAIVGAAILLTVVAAVFAATSSSILIGLVLIGPVLLLLVAATSLFWRVRVDVHAVTVRSVVGLPRFRVPIAQLESAAPVTVDPFVEFGGWGIRFAGSGRLGVVVRSGEGLELRRSDGRTLTVTVADSVTAAAVANGLVARARARSGA